MNKNEIFEFVRANPVFALGTVEGNLPHVRMMMLYRADERGIVFSTGENKDVHNQLEHNAAVELCFVDGPKECEVRIAGSVEVVEDMELKKQIVCDFPFLKEWIDREGYDVLVVYCLKGGKATSWTMERNLKPKEYVQL